MRNLAHPVRLRRLTTLQVVTYKWLSRNFDVPSARAKQCVLRSHEIRFALTRSFAVHSVSREEKHALPLFSATRLLYKYVKSAGEAAQSVYLLAGWTKVRRPRPLPLRAGARRSDSSAPRMTRSPVTAGDPERARRAARQVGRARRRPLQALPRDVPPRLQRAAGHAQGAAPRPPRAVAATARYSSLLQRRARPLSPPLGTAISVTRLSICPSCRTLPSFTPRTTSRASSSTPPRWRAADASKISHPLAPALRAGSEIASLTSILRSLCCVVQDIGNCLRSGELSSIKLAGVVRDASKEPQRKPRPESAAPPPVRPLAPGSQLQFCLSHTGRGRFEDRSSASVVIRALRAPCHRPPQAPAAKPVERKAEPAKKPLFPPSAVRLRERDHTGRLPHASASVKIASV